MRYRYIKKFSKKSHYPWLPKILLICAIIIFLFTVFYKKNENGQGNIQTPSFSPPIQKSTTKPTPPLVKDTNQKIQQLLESSVINLPGKYAVVIKNLKKNHTYEINATDTFASASIYKLAVMYKVYDSLDKGELQKNLELAPGLTVGKALESMITISDNNSAILLAEKVGWAKTDTFLKNKGINGFNLTIQDYPETTASATAQILERIYTKTAVSRQASSEMSLLLFKQKINDRIPRYLPKDVKVGHKTGELDNFRHDAAIVVGKKSDYIFVFLSQTPAPADAAENIAALSKAIYDALESD
ncbi:MAG: serine hydrolase [Patescibacteria group bacterium]